MRTTPYILAVSLSLAYVVNAFEHPPLTLVTDPPSPPAPATQPPPHPLHIDSDGDGLTNAWDEYPFDDGVKRKEPVGIRHYGLVPLTSYSRGEMIGQFNGGNLEIPSTIGCIALDDEHRVSWWTREQKTRDADALTYNIHHWWTWDNNAISDKRQKLDTLPAIGGGGKSEAWAPSDISPRGMLVGTWTYQLMHPSGGERPQDYWIRNEDWVLANEAAAFLQ
jgi:hypothetical protein